MCTKGNLNQNISIFKDNHRSCAWSLFFFWNCKLKCTMWMRQRHRLREEPEHPNMMMCTYLKHSHVSHRIYKSEWDCFVCNICHSMPYLVAKDFLLSVQVCVAPVRLSTCSDLSTSHPYALSIEISLLSVQTSCPYIVDNKSTLYWNIQKQFST